MILGGERSQVERSRRGLMPRLGHSAASWRHLPSRRPGAPPVSGGGELSQVEGSCLRWRGAIIGGGEQPQV